MGFLSSLVKPVAGILGGGLLGYSAYESGRYADKASKATQESTELQKEYLNWLKDYYNKTYGGMVEGDWNNPLYAGAKSDAERAYTQSVDNTMRILSARGLGRSGLLGRYLQQAGYNRVAMLSGLKPQLLTQAGNFIRGTGGAYAQAGQGLLGQANLYNQFAQSYGAPVGQAIGLGTKYMFGF